MKNFRVSERIHPKIFSLLPSRQKKTKERVAKGTRERAKHTPKRERERERLFNDDKDEDDSVFFFFFFSSNVFSLVVFSERDAR